MIAKKRAEIAARLAKAKLGNGNQSMPTAATLPQSDGGSKRDAERGVARGGLDVAVHPALMADSSSRNKRQPIMPMFATAKANQRPVQIPKRKQMPLVDPRSELREATKNPYYDPNVGGGDATPRERTSKRLKFVSKGKYVNRANQIRQQVSTSPPLGHCLLSKAHLEDLKRRIAESTRKAGLENELEVSDQAITVSSSKSVIIRLTFQKEPPPDVEWWDALLLPNKTYDDAGEHFDDIIVNSSLISNLIQHPIPIPPPQDKNAPDAKPLMLTKKEQKKMRRQRRLEDQKEMTDKIRLGLMPPPPPKGTSLHELRLPCLLLVKLSNLMKVLTNDAIQDPTKVEAKMRREVAKRHEEHLRQNEERKLTNEQRREKKHEKHEQDARKGIKSCIFRVENLSSKKHLAKVERNAKQCELTGIVILNPKFNLVVIEGGPRSVKFYKKLMLARMQWNEDLPEPDPDKADQQPAVGENQCRLIWEGDLKDRQYRGFRFKPCPADALAKQALGSGREAYWDIAKRITDDEAM